MASVSSRDTLVANLVRIAGPSWTPLPIRLARAHGSAATERLTTPAEFGVDVHDRRYARHATALCGPDPLMSRVNVVDNQVDAALKQLKKLMLKDGAFQEMKRRAYYEKPSVKRKRKAAAARKKRRRALARARDGDRE